ncbi:hypothetical protein FS595_22005 [Serratia rubidaea]|nr:hypothetical protein [Serratia rubidaea]UJD82242.1 hypothetical protein FS596_22010 [Serratia rubidaea]UJD86806.1 hypothetical protein FS595_22005 [Serratia rubidaea]
MDISVPLSKVVSHLKLFTSLLAASTLLVSIIGIGVMLLYLCVEGIGISSLSLKESMTFIIVAVLFSFIMVVGLVYGAYATVAPMTFLAYLVTKFWGRGLVRHKLVQGKITLFLSLILLLFFVAILCLPGDSQRSWPVVYFLCIGLIFNMLFLFHNREGEHPLYQRIGAMFFVSCGLMLIAPIPKALSNYPMMMLGYRSWPSDAILMDAEHQKRIQGYAALVGVPVKTCRVGEDRYVSDDITLVWDSAQDGKQFIRFKQDDTFLFPLQGGQPLEKIKKGKRQLCRDAV